MLVILTPPATPVPLPKSLAFSALTFTPRPYPWGAVKLIVYTRNRFLQFTLTLFQLDVIFLHMCFVILIANTLHRQRRANAIPSITTNERSSLFRTMHLSQMTTELFRRSEKYLITANCTALPWF